MEHRGADGEDLYQPCTLSQLKPHAAKTEAARETEIFKRWEEIKKKIKALVPMALLFSTPFCLRARTLKRGGVRLSQAKEARIEGFS